MRTVLSFAVKRTNDTHKSKTDPDAKLYRERRWASRSWRRPARSLRRSESTRASEGSFQAADTQARAIRRTPQGKRPRTSSGIVTILLWPALFVTVKTTV